MSRLADDVGDRLGEFEFAPAHFSRIPTLTATAFGRS
jgi:hypothetical protein